VDWLSFACGMGAAICLLFLFFLFLPIRTMQKKQDSSLTVLHEYWRQNQVETERQSVALEAIADRLLKWAK